MNEAWNKHIQPILDSWQWDHFSWVWDPFYAKYPKFSDEQKALVDEALATCAFDASDEESATKALGIAGFLQNNHLATHRLSELMKNGLRDKISALDANSALTFDYVVAFKFFGIKEAIPCIQQLVLQMEERNVNGRLDERPSPQSHTFRYILEKYSSIIQDLMHES
jgi:hypothetical protein